MKFERALTDTVLLREARVGDAAALADAHRRNREHLAPWDPERAPSFFEPGGQLAMLTARIASAEAGEQQPFHLMEGERVVGTIALNQIVRGPLQKASVGYWVDRERTGQGLAKAALAVVVDVAATRLRLHRLEASALPHNAGSRAVLAASGFEQYGTAPGYLRIAGEWREHVLYQRLLDETPTRGL